jgi:L-asparaginase
MQGEEPIRILMTGGTIDKEYDPLTGELTFAKSHLSNILNQVRCKARFVLEEVMLKDSLQMRSEDREEVLKRCVDCQERRIIVTHGTDTMVETGRVLGNNVKGKTIVLVGAMIPYVFVQSWLRICCGSGFPAGSIYHNEWKDFPLG